MIFGFKYDLDISTKHPKFDPAGVQTNDLQIMDSTFHVPETLAGSLKHVTSSCWCIMHSGNVYIALRGKASLICASS